MVYVTNVITHMATRWSLAWGKSKVDILFDRQSASQPACQLQLASQPAMWQNINLSGFWLVRWWQKDRDPDHIGPQSRVPALLLVFPRQWPTWARPGKWHKWAWHYFQGLFCSFVSTSPNHMYLAWNVEKCYTDYFLSRPIYSYPSTINYIVLIHQCTTFEELLLSSQIRNAMEKSLTKGQTCQK